MKKLSINFVALLCATAFAQAQNLGINTATPNASAALDVTSTSKRLLIPRMDSAQRSGIASPANGLMVYQTNGLKPGFYYYSGSTWKVLQDSTFFAVNSRGSIAYANPANNGKNFLVNTDNVNYTGSGLQTKMMFVPSKSAFRVGTINGTDWDSTNLGQYSFATGLYSKATGMYATAMGTGSATADGATAFSNGSASGTYATAMGSSAYASGTSSFASGYQAYASGSYATSMGYTNYATGLGSAAIGYRLFAQSFGEVAVGFNNNNATVYSSTDNHPNDRAFSVGTGWDALTVFKSGSTYIDNGGFSIVGNNSIITGYTRSALQVRSYTDGINVLSPASNNTLNLFKAGAASSNQTFVSFGYTNGSSSTEYGSIKYNGSNISYNTASDMRLKIDNGTYKTGLATIGNIKIHNYTWKESKTADVGVFAQELYKAYPAAVSKGDDDMSVTDPEKIKSRWQVDYSKLVPVLVAAVQELQQEIELLKAGKK